MGRVNSIEHSLLLYLCDGLVVCKDHPDKIGQLIAMALVGKEHRSKAYIKAIKRFDGITSPETIVATVDKLKKDLL